METSIFTVGELPEFKKFTPESISKQFPEVLIKIGNDFKNIEDRRIYHLKLLNESIDEKKDPIIVDHSLDNFEHTHSFVRIGSGSLGGKARGLAFANSILRNYDFKNQFPNINVRIPNIVVISTSGFDEFMDKNNLWLHYPLGGIQEK